MLRATEDDAERRWLVGPAAVRALLVVPFLGAVLITATALWRPLFRFLTSEDGPLEILQFVLDVVALIGAVAVSRRLHRSGHAGWAALWAVLALTLVFIAGEEISWGQRIFDVDTPERLSRLNHQEETNLHNIGPIQDAVNTGFMLVGAYGSIGALALRRWSRTRSAPWLDLFVPPTFLFSLFVIVFGYKLLRVTVLPSPRFLVVKSGEYVELCMSVALAAFTVLTWRRLGAGIPAEREDGR